MCFVEIIKNAVFEKSAFYCPKVNQLLFLNIWYRETNEPCFNDENKAIQISFHNTILFFKKWSIFEIFLKRLFYIFHLTLEQSDFWDNRTWNIYLFSSLKILPVSNFNAMLVSLGKNTEKLILKKFWRFSKTKNNRVRDDVISYQFLNLWHLVVLYRVFDKCLLIARDCTGEVKIILVFPISSFLNLPQKGIILL